MKRLKVGDLVRINSNCENTRRVVYRVIKARRYNGEILYTIENTYSDKKFERQLKREELSVAK